MTVISNTLNNNDVGVQVQAGHLPYTPFSNVNGNESNLNRSVLRARQFASGV
jgi:hypothetical protein